MKNKLKAEKWRNYEFSTGATTGEDYTSFQKDARSDLNKMAKEEGLIVHSFNKNHYCFSAILKTQGGKYIYTSISDVRFFPNEFLDHVLIRTMKNEKDYTGGTNNYCLWSDIGKTATKLANRM